MVAMFYLFYDTCVFFDTKNSSHKGQRTCRTRLLQVQISQDSNASITSLATITEIVLYSTFMHCPFLYLCSTYTCWSYSHDMLLSPTFSSLILAPSFKIQCSLLSLCQWLPSDIGLLCEFFSRFLLKSSGETNLPELLNVTTSCLCPLYFIFCGSHSLYWDKVLFWRIFQFYFSYTVHSPFS
jgi:hypothetical protein